MLNVERLKVGRGTLVERPQAAALGYTEINLEGPIMAPIMGGSALGLEAALSRVCGPRHDHCEWHHQNLKEVKLRVVYEPPFYGGCP